MENDKGWDDLLDSPFSQDVTDTFKFTLKELCDHPSEDEVKGLLIGLYESVRDYYFYQYYTME